MEYHRILETGDITICYDFRRTSSQWYARIPLICPNDEPLFRRLLGQNTLEVNLQNGRTIDATKRIIEELQRRGISTIILRIKPYQKS